MRIVRAAGILALCAGIATSCGKAHHSRLVLKVVGKADQHQLDLSAVVLRRRIDLLGLHDVDLRLRLPGRILVTTRRALTRAQQQVLTKPGSLAFYDLEADLATASTNGYSPIASPRLDQLLSRARATEGGTSGLVLVNAHGQLAGGPVPTRALLPRKPGTKVLAVPAHTTVVRCAASRGCPGVGVESKAKTFYYLFQYYPDRAGDPIPEATGRDLNASETRADMSSQGQGNIVVIGFKSGGARKFREITQTEAARGQALADAAGDGRASDLPTVAQYAQHFAMVLDGELESTPYIDYKQNPGGIDPTGTGAELSNIQSYSEAKNLALVLRSGALPFRLVVAR